MSRVTKNLVLYSHIVCPFAQRSRIVIHEKKLEHEEVQIDLSKPRPQWFLQLNPKGKVPTLDHNGKIVYESSIINEYLEEAFPEVKMFPSDPYERAKARLLIDYASSVFIPAYYGFLMNTDEKKSDEKKKAILDSLETLDKELANTSENAPFFLGNKFSLVDAAIIPWFVRWCVLEHYKGLKIPKELSKLNAWIAECLKRDSVKKTSEPDKYYIDAYAQYAKGVAKV